MSDYVPSEREVRETWMDAMVMHSPTTSSAEFDRFIAKIKADALREAAGDWRKHLRDTEASYSCAESWLKARAERIEGEA